MRPEQIGDVMVEGPFEQLEIAPGRNAGLYLLRYDTDGSLLSPRTQQLLLAELTTATDVFVFSHGWNNDFAVAAGAYRKFIEGYSSQGPAGPACRPLLIGVVWPSSSLLMPWEDGPQIAAGPSPGSQELMRAFVAGSLDQHSRARLSELIGGSDTIAADQAREAAGLLLTSLTGATDQDDDSARPTVDEVLRCWAELDGQAAPKPADPDDFGDVTPPAPAAGAQTGGDEAGAGGVVAPQVAGILGNLDPRNLLRMATVWKMKDRAGQVGARGVGPLLRQILADSQARVHLVGHSFGARVVLSALCIEEPARPVRSMLLLQPAINRWCFAGDVVGKGVPGGYHSALDRVELPILTTRSDHDVPLRQAFQLVVRGSSLGEPDIAAVGDTFRFGALGGYGPGGVDAVGGVQAARPPGQPYGLPGQARVITVDGSGELDGHPAIGGHSDINNQVTWWALRCLVTAAVP